MTLLVEVVAPCRLWSTLDFDATKVARDIVPVAYNKAKLPAALRKRTAEVSVMLTDDRHIKKLNKKYRKKDKPTNVLSFAVFDPDALPPEDPCPLGDIIIAYETVAHEAASMDVPFRDHYTHLLVHGTLHLLGYDHEEDDQAETMEALEILILKGLGIDNPYESRDCMA